MFEGMFLEREIKEKLSELEEIDRDMHEYILNEKIEFDKFKVFKKTIKQTIKRYLARIIGFQKTTIKDYPKKLKEEYTKRITLKELINKINFPSNKRKILYITCAPPFNIVRQSLYLRREGYETILLMEGGLSLINLVEKSFDTVYVFNSIYELFYILKEAKPYLVHVQGTTRRANHFGILAKLFTESKVVFNFYDIPSTTVTEDDITADGNLIGGKDVVLDLFSERFACEKCDGLIFGYSAKVEEILKRRYNIKVPMLEFNSYPCDEFISEEDNKYSDRDGKIHIAYAGNVYPSHLPEKYFGDTQFHSIINMLTRQGIYFDIYFINIKPLRIKREYSDYVRMSEENPLFKFKKGMLVDQITKALCGYDFGAMINHWNKGTFYNKGPYMEEHVKMRLPDKFFTYMEAGLPIILTEEVEYGARLVKEYEMGIVVSQSDLYNLSEIINRYDREKLRANVKRAREELSMKKHIGRLIDFYEQVVGNK